MKSYVIYLVNDPSALGRRKAYPTLEEAERAARALADGRLTSEWVDVVMVRASGITVEHLLCYVFDREGFATEQEIVYSARGSRDG